MARGNKNFRLVQREGNRSGKLRYDVHLTSNGQHVAIIGPDGQSGYRFVLDNYPQNQSKQFGTIKACLAALENEVL